MKVGVLGGGQLGRMLALAGYPLGLSFRFLEPLSDPPVNGLGEVVRAAYDDAGALARFAEALDVVTYEFENVPVESVRALERRLPVRPSPAALEAAQDRLCEKELMQALGIETAHFVAVEDRSALRAATKAIGLPAVLKTRREGYDGKGQAVLRTEDDVDRAWARLGGRDLLLETFIDFSRELSVVGVRAASGEARFYPMGENRHEDGILRVTVAPAPGIDSTLQRTAEEYALRIMERVDYVGVLAVELFEHDGRLLVNEIAPRVHNSGHWTQDGAVTCQFENHLRAVCGLPLGATEARGRTTMTNLIGHVPDRAALLTVPDAHVHLYGKSPRPGRKLGHVNRVETLALSTSTES